MRIWMMTVLLALAPAAEAEAEGGKLGWLRAHEIVDLWQDFSVNDDIIAEDYAGFVRAVDLDGDGTDEIVYLNSSYCIGSSSDCPNSIDVLRKRVPGKTPSIGRRVDEWEARARKTGYVPDAGEQIPGEVMELQTKGNRIDVTFVVRETSPICLRHQRAPDGSDRCPPPGRYTWAYAWAPGKLTRLSDSRYEKNVAKSHFPAQLQGKWVIAGSSCEKADDPSHYLTFGNERMTGMGEDIWPNLVTLLARTPWTWQILTTSASDPDKEVAAVFMLGQRGDRLVVAEESRVRTFDRCSF